MYRDFPRKQGDGRQWKPRAKRFRSVHFDFLDRYNRVQHRLSNGGGLDQPGTAGCTVKWQVTHERMRFCEYAQSLSLNCFNDATRLECG